MSVNLEWAQTYTNSGVGELVQTILYPLGFAKFILVLLVLSGSMYTTGCSRPLL